MKLITLVRIWGSKAGLLQAIVAGLCLGSGFIFPVLWLLGILGIAWCIHVAIVAVSYRQALRYGFIVWFIKALCSISWSWSAYPISWIEIASPIAQLGSIFFYWLTAGLCLSFGGICFAVLVRYLWSYRSVSLGVKYILVPSLWLVCELVSALVFSLVTVGPGSFIQAYFSFGMVGYLLGTIPGGIFLAAFFGVYGLTVIIVGLATAVYAVISMSQDRVRFVVVCCLLGLLVIGHSGFIFNPVYLSQGITVIGIDTTFDAPYLITTDGQNQKAELLDTAVTAALLQSPEFILLPEDSRYLSSYDADNPHTALTYYQFLHPDSQTFVIDSGRFETATSPTVLRTTIFNSVTKRLIQFDKQYLVPQGEYIPYLYGGILRLFVSGEAVNSLVRDSSYTVGLLREDASVPDAIPGVLFCFESVRPGGSNVLMDIRQVPFIAHPISHSWFHSPHILWRQLDVMLQIQARVSGVPIVSAGNMVGGKLYLPTGEIVFGDVLVKGERFVLREYRF